MLTCVCVCVCVCVCKVEWGKVRREKGGDALNRFLATWEKLHADPQATPTLKRAVKLGREGQRVKSERAKAPAAQGPTAVEEREEREEGRERAEPAAEFDEDEEDIVEDFEFSSSDSDSD